MGGGGGKTTATSSSKPSPEVEGMLKEFRTASTPLLREQANQFMEALTTGGVGARIPIINKAVESPRQAASSANRQTGESVERAGLSRTPFGEMVSGGVRQAGEQSVAGIPIDLIREILAQIPNFILGSGQTIVSAPTTQTSKTVQPWTQAFAQLGQGFSGFFPKGV